MIYGNKLVFGFNGTQRLSTFLKSSHYYTFASLHALALTVKFAAWIAGFLSEKEMKLSYKNG